MIKTLFLIHDLGHGGAEKVLVNLVNNMDPSKFDITVLAMFGGGVNEQFLKPHIKYRAVFQVPFRGNSHFMKLFSPKMLHDRFIRERYDIEISYLEGPSARIISGCTDPNTKLVGWVHIEQKSVKQAAASFRSVNEFRVCSSRFDMHVGVSDTVRSNFLSLFPNPIPMTVLYNTNESKQILEFAKESVDEGLISRDSVNLIGVGKLLPGKGFDRLCRIVKKLRDGDYPVHLYLLGVGSQRHLLEKYADENHLSDVITFLGYQTNPYKYMANCDIFVCSSYREGFSTAASEALIVGTPVVTTLVSGMKELLGENNDYGIVTANDEDALHEGIRRLLDDPELFDHYRMKAAERGKMFSTEKTVKAVEDMLLSMR